MPTQTATLADRLLDAQVAWVIEECTGAAAAETLARLVDDLLGVTAALSVSRALDRSAAKDIARRALETVSASPLIMEGVTTFADSLYDLEANEDHRLGEVFSREPVEALLAKALAAQQLQERVLDRLGQSPLVATIAAKFVTKLVSDIVAQNKARAERVPGMSSVIKIGTSAANRVKSPFDKQLDHILGDAAERSAQTALRRTTRTIQEMIAEAPLQDALLEVWDLHADEAIGELREYLSKDDLREFAVLVHDVIISARDSAFFAAITDMIVDVFFDKHGDKTLLDLLNQLGFSRGRLVTDARLLAPLFLEQARASGQLEAQVRAGLARFWSSDLAAAALAEA
jgi:hypothetical protein